MRFVAFVLMTLLPGFVSQGLAQSKFFTQSVTMNLDLPASTEVGGINNLKNTLTVNRYASNAGGAQNNLLGTGSNFGGSKLNYGSGVTSFLVEVNPTSGLIIRGMKHLSATSTSDNLTIPQFVVSGGPPDVNIRLNGTGLGGSSGTPSGNYEPVTSGTQFDAAQHTTLFNQGSNVTTVGGFSSSTSTKNLSVTPLVYPGSGTGTIAVTQTGKSGFNRTYSIKVSQPLNSSLLVDTTLVNYFGQYRLFKSTMNVQGSVVGTGSVTVEVKPALEVLGPVVGGTEVKIKGIIGEQAKLMAGDTPSAITRTVGTYTLAAAETTVTDPGAIGKARQFYTVVPGP